MSTVTVEQAQANLPDLIDRLAPGEELVIVRNHQPVAKLVAERPSARKPRQPGSACGKILYMADDFDAPLDEFRDYME